MTLCADGCGVEVEPYWTRGRNSSAGRGLRKTCHSRHARRGTLYDYPLRASRRRADLLADYEVLRAQGHDARQIAARMGMKFLSFDRSMHRAKAAGDPRAANYGRRARTVAG